MWFSENIDWKVKNGRSLSLWNFKWSGRASLKKSYDRLYALSNIKEGSIREMWNDCIDDWDINPRRTLNDRKNNQWRKIKSGLPILSQHGGNDIPL